ncbi:hypothetical protein [Bdellovibrio svalbardensis]|uniref:Uncharacterized protein n=1 Tax=Bdellovibrio svalbardensis TaxID=2972972 RepID=A0ABT6DJD9_9BACT|nr:hypothetical protein [Bdellovibrio svalbardensis]MDG0816034.1 hypothetical protein [Bdellovibrio svalbardensis]
MKRIEVKLALIDQVMPTGKLKWSERIFNLGLLRVRDLNALFSKYQIQDFQDPYLRKQFITQLYTLHETPWMGLRKSVELSRNERLQEWVVRTSEQRMLNAGLRELVDEMSLGNASILKLAQVNLKKVLSSGWLGLPTRLPMFNKPLEPIIFEKILWEGPASYEQALRSVMKKDHAADVYNNFTRAYNKAAMVALIAVLYYTLPQMQDELEEQVLKAQESHAQDPENVKKRDEAFQKAMANLDKMAQQIDELNNQDPKEQMFQETLVMFESANNRKATATEIQTLREKLGLLH